MPEAKDDEERRKAALQQGLDEARMILPGIQALFGFQLIAIFNERFESLEEGLRWIHLMALFAVALAIALIMSPAAFHRQTHPHHVTERLLRVTTWFVSAALVPLMLGLALELYLVTAMVISSTFPAVAAGCVALILFGFLWFVFPRFSHDTG